MTTITDAAAPAPRRAVRAAEPQSPPLLLRAVHALASLKLTVTLLAMAIFLVFAGTLAQVHAGIWTVMADYFRTPIAWIDLRIFLPADTQVGGSFPFPGGYTLGGLLLANLLAAHLVRFHASWKRSGILLIHGGLIVLMVSEFVTGVAAEEGQMTIWEGGSSSFVEDIREVELALIDTTDPRFNDVRAIPEARFAHAAEGPVTIDDASLPFIVRVDRFDPNAQLLGVAGIGGSLPNPANAGSGLRIVARPMPPVTGTDPDQRVNSSAAYVTLVDRSTGSPLGTWLTALQLSQNNMPQVFQHGGRTYELDLRFKRVYKPYRIELLDFRHERYPGTNVPKAFESHIRLIDPQRGEDRAAVIRMNHPLRYAGETFFQAAFKEGDRGTVLQVVDNPGWLMPYVSCALITLGLVVHFLLSLTRFVGRQGRSRA